MDEFIENKVVITPFKRQDVLFVKFTYKKKHCVLSLNIYLKNRDISLAEKECERLSALLSLSKWSSVNNIKSYFLSFYLEVFEKLEYPFIKKFKSYSSLNSIYNESKKRARIKNIDFSFSLEDLKYLYLFQYKKCAITGYELSLDKKNLYKLSIDRKNNDLGYIKGNIQLVCLGINYLKNTFDNKEVIDFLKNIKLTQ